MPRPPSFERSAVIGQATAVFWQRGYGATSVNHLVDATGLKPGSLYAAFGSKKGLFLEVLEAYSRAFLAEVDACERSAPTALAALRQLLERAATATLGANGARGCLAVNTLLEMAEHDPDIAATLRAHNERLRARLQRIIARAQVEGEIAPDHDAGRQAVFVLNNLWGIRVLCKSAPSRDALDSIIAGVMSALAS